MEGGAGKIAILSTLSTNHKARKKKKSGFHNSRYRFKCSHTISMKNLNVKH